jgi:flagellar biosynthetic protein FliR
MAEYSMSDWMSLEIYRTLLVFIRVSTAFMLLPGFGEPFVPTRMRILAALAVAVAVVPTVSGMPTAPPMASEVIVAILAEVMNGALLGTLARTVISAVLVTGQIVSQSIGLTNIFASGLAVDESSTVGAALYAGIVAVLFASNGHHAILRALAESYNVLSPGHFPKVASSARAVVAAGVRCFRLGAQLALPFLLLALIFNVTLAAVNRAMPSLPIFMIANPAIVVLGLYLLAATVPGLVDGGLSGWSELPSLLQ